MNAAPVANLPVSRQRQRQQSYQSPVAAHRQNHKLIAGGERRSLSGSDGRCWQLAQLACTQTDRGQVMQSSPKPNVETMMHLLTRSAAVHCMQGDPIHRQHDSQIRTWNTRPRQDMHVVCISMNGDRHVTYEEAAMSRLICAN